VGVLQRGRSVSALPLADQHRNPAIDAYGFDPKDLIGVTKTRCWICRTLVLRATSQSKYKPLCQNCFNELVADEKKAGSQVVESEHKETVLGVKRSPYRTDR
jgi:hypothetical protein